MDILYTPDASTLEEWKDLLGRQNIPYETVIERGEAGIRTTALGMKMIRERYGMEATLSEQQRKNLKGNKKLFKYAGIPFLLVFGSLLVFIFTAEPTPPSPEQLRRQEFDLGSHFAVRVQQQTKELLNYPRSYELEGWNVFLHDPDSVTIVHSYSAQNAFGMRKDHSTTVVADNEGNIARVVSAQ